MSSYIAYLSHFLTHTPTLSHSDFLTRIFSLVYFCSVDATDAFFVSILCGLIAYYLHTNNRRSLKRELRLFFEFALSALGMATAAQLALSNFTGLSSDCVDSSLRHDPRVGMDQCGYEPWCVSWRYRRCLCVFCTRDWSVGGRHISFHRIARQGEV